MTVHGSWFTVQGSWFTVQGSWFTVFCSLFTVHCLLVTLPIRAAAEAFPKPYSPPCTERENVFAFTEKPSVRAAGPDRHEISFAVKGACDVAVGLIDSEGRVVRHLGAGVLGSNAPQPFQKNSLKQTIVWNGKDDLGTYVAEPGKLRVRVMLGLKPEFDKRLGGTSPKNLGGYVFGLAVDENAAYVFSKGPGSHGRVDVRKFDRDGNYLAALTPPPANLPESRLGGYGYVEYEPGVRTPHAVTVTESVSRNGFILPGVNGKGIGSCQVAVVGNRIYFSNSGNNLLAGHGDSLLYYIHTDGSSEVAGLKGLPLADGSHLNPRFAASPDGKWLYMVGIGHAVLRRALEGGERAKLFAGERNKPGSDDAHFNEPSQLDCDGQGRVYVADRNNNRIQVLTPEGRLHRSIPLDGASLVVVHRKTGALYVKHTTRIEGKTTDRISKLRSADDPRVEWVMDGYPAGLMALDFWSPRPRLWTAGNTFESHTGGSFGSGPGVVVWEDDGKSLRKIVDFDEDAKQEAGENYIGRWSGNGATGDKVTCDPVRGRVIYRNRFIFDLKTGRLIGQAQFPYSMDDFAVDKKGYYHAHFNPGFYTPGVGRLDPGRAIREKDGERYPETPYDYGIEKTGPWNQKWLGVLPVRDQPGAKYFQDGIGVNMRGDVAVESNIYYAPKMEEEGIALARAGIDAQLKAGQYYDGNQARRFERHIEELKRLGEDIYFIPRRPGHPAIGGTVWTFNASGELRKELAVNAGDIVNGVQIDEDYAVYFVTARPRIFANAGPYFLAGRGGTYGAPDDTSNRNPFTGTLIKTRPDTTCNILLKGATVPLEPVPERPPDLMATDWPDVSGPGGWSWVDGAEWLYAGASPIVSTGCSCPKQMLHTDWYKRTFVPEAYRHSIGVLDTAGNLILHIGRYGNFDSGSGPDSRIPVGGDGIGLFTPRFLSGTDDYLVFDDRGERLVVLKLNYHAEATAGIQ